MVKVPCKITPLGDKDYARNFIGAGQSQLRILEEEMKARGLVQGVRRSRLDPRTIAEATITHQLQEVKIHSQPLKKKVEEVGEELAEKKRFFAKVRRGGIYGEVSYHWIVFTEGGDIKITSAGSSGYLLKRMSSVPYTVTRNTHAFTKSFMITNEDDVEERWTAAPHLLIKEEYVDEEKTYVEVFNPLGYPYAKTNLLGKDFRYYPLPPLCVGSPLQHPCPPNRFYCNTDERKMVWYSCYTVLDYTIPSAPVLVHYCFGIILTLTNDMVSETYYSPGSETEYYKLTDPGTGKELIKTFNCYSAEADSEGFNPLWYYQPTGLTCTPPTPDPMCGVDADVPYQMLLDVNSLSEDTLEVFVPWGERPLKFTVDLTGPNVGTTESDHTYEEVTETDHWYWTEDGFEQEKFCELDYTDQPGGVVDYSTNTVVSHTHSGCNCPKVIACGPADMLAKAALCCCTGCGATVDSGKFEETFSAQWQRIYWRRSGSTHHRRTFYYLYLPSETLYMKSWDWETATVQGKMGEGEYCLANWANYSPGCMQLHCDGPHPHGPKTQIRFIGETLKQKLADSLDAEWCGPNVIFVGAEKNRVYTDAWREQGNYEQSSFRGEYLIGRYYGLEATPAAFASDYWAAVQEYIDIDTCGYPSADSFADYVDPGVLWGSGITSSSFSRHNSMVDYGGDPFESVFCGSILGAWYWKRLGTANTLDEPLVLQYRVDGEGSFSSIDHNRTYYLDDRSSYDSEGLISAARGAICVDYTIEGYPIFEVASWSIVYKKPNTSSFELITDKLLEALDCNASELIELGLV